MDKLLTQIFGQSDLFLFTHKAFWVFMGVVLLISAVLNKKRTLRSTFLFIASLFFYFKTGGYFFSLLIISTLTDYSIGLLIDRSAHKLKRKLLLTLSITINLSLLVYFKYTYFIAESYANLVNTQVDVYDYLANFINQVFHTDFNIASITLPVGISFFTFQTISYTIDVYRKELKPVTNIIDFGFYVSFFPQLIAGPIVRAKHFIPQIYRRIVLSEKWIWRAILLILGGLFKKMVISDYISVNFVDRIFEQPIVYSGVEILTGVYAYALQIYCDFSGYTDIALGLGLLLGFRLPINFNHPYKACSIQDFWRRWHISLSTWLRDYLYISMGGNQKGIFRTLLHLMLTMLIGGLWHGAALKFVIWGGLHGIGLIINRLTKKLFKKAGQWINVAGWLVTFHFVTLTWIVFRVDTLENAQIMIDRIFRAFMPGRCSELLMAYPYFFILLTIGFTLHWLPEKWMSRLRLSFILAPVWIKILISAAIIFLISNLHESGLQPFIYFRF